ncbi:hypothetical protein HDF16_002586 [Granulicella aggregans]|uniref:Uncharacterized protein n=1 Tax=Granulicella aggregans TaxID=474949 RepID=A0A7W7ZDF6_9BACT|nr:hypothetical protein [Granulicella aggregans]
MLISVQSRCLHVRDSILLTRHHIEAEFDKVWKLAPGQFYNEEPVKTALQKLASNKAFQGYVPRPGLAPNSQSHLVIVTISFVKGARP